MPAITPTRRLKVLHPHVPVIAIGRDAAHLTGREKKAKLADSTPQEEKHVGWVIIPTWMKTHTCSEISYRIPDVECSCIGRAKNTPN